MSATLQGSNGIETSVVNTDIIQVILDRLGWTQYINYETKKFEFYALDNIEISVNNLPSFVLMAGDEIEETSGIFSFVLLTNGARYRYYAKM